jgi:hypothetical protein
MANEERATPYNRPLPQWQPPAPEDPSATRLVEGGALKLNDQDREGLAKWFQASFMNQLSENSWFTRDWLPEFMAPLYYTVNANFDKAIDLIDKNNEQFLKLREEVLVEVAKVRKEIAADVVKARDDMQRQMADWVKTKNKEFTDELAKMRQIVMTKCNSDLNVMRDDLLRVLRRDMKDDIRKINDGLIITRSVESADRIEENAKAIKAAVETTRTDMMTIYNTDLQSMRAEILDVLRQELAQEIIKMREAKT